MNHLLRVAFYKSNCEYADKWDRFIDKHTGNLGYSHTEIILDVDNGLYQYSSSITDNGVRRKEHIIDHDVWDYKLYNITQKEFDTILEFFNKIMGNKYDKLGLVGFILPIIDREDRWFCSETSSRALQIIGLKQLMVLESSRLSPNKLYTIL